MATQVISYDFKTPVDQMDPRPVRTTVTINFDVATDYVFITKDIREPFMVMGKDDAGEWVPVSYESGVNGWNITIPYINKVVTLKIQY